MLWVSTRFDAGRDGGYFAPQKIVLAIKAHSYRLLVIVTDEGGERRERREDGGVRRERREEEGGRSEEREEG